MAAADDGVGEFRGDPVLESVTKEGLDIDDVRNFNDNDDDDDDIGSIGDACTVKSIEEFDGKKRKSYKYAHPVADRSTAEVIGMNAEDVEVASSRVKPGCMSAGCNSKLVVSNGDNLHTQVGLQPPALAEGGSKHVRACMHVCVCV